MHTSSDGQVKRARIEIIPLIDVIFFLLATFVLFTLSLNKSEGLPVPLPQVTTGEPRDTANSHTVTVTSEGHLAWDQEDVTLAGFIEHLQRFYQQEPEGRILINGDERATFSQAVYVFDEARKAGFERIYIETRSRAAGSEPAP
ncbi:MAG: ExbD/TolR family protein [Opitutaceae bacterium]